MNKYKASLIENIESLLFKLPDTQELQSVKASIRMNMLFLDNIDDKNDHNDCFKAIL